MNIAGIKKTKLGRSSPTLGFVGVSRGDVLGEHLEALLALVVQPQVHLAPRLVLLRRLSLEVPLTVAHPQFVGIFCEPLQRDEGRESLVSDRPFSMATFTKKTLVMTAQESGSVTVC